MKIITDGPNLELDDCIRSIEESDPDNKIYGLIRGGGYPTKLWVEDQSGNVIVAHDDVLTLAQAVRLLHALGIEVKT